MLQSHLGDRLGDSRRLRDVVFRWATMGHSAIGAVSRAHVAEDHERCGAVLPAFAHVGAVGFLAHRVEVQLAHEALEAKVVRSAGSFHLEPGWLALGERLRAVTPHYLIKSIWHRLGLADERTVELPQSTLKPV